MSDTLPRTQVGTGAPLVVIPGLSARRGVPSRYRRWVQLREVRDLSARREVWSIRRRVGLEAGISVQQLAAEYADALRELFDEPVDVVGVSTGGSIALQLAADHPQLVRRLVLVSSAHRLSDRGRATQRRVAELLRHGRSRRAAAVFLGATGATPPSRALLGAVGALAPRMVVGRGDSDLVVTLDAEDSFDLSPRLADMATPILVTGGGNDQFYGSEIFARTHAALPQSRLELYPRSGHIGTLGNRLLARHILSFLESPEL